MALEDAFEILEAPSLPFPEKWKDTLLSDYHPAISLAIL